jgi:hypothetical protein
VVAQRDTYGGLVRHLLNPAPRWIAALFVLAYILSLAFRIMDFYSRSMSDPLWGVSRGLQLMFSQPSTVVVVKAVAFAALLFLASVSSSVNFKPLSVGTMLNRALCCLKNKPDSLNEIRITLSKYLSMSCFPQHSASNKPTSRDGNYG